ncbi:MAG: pyruvoyl-dependent arginine decarboxylase [Candidatus Pacebacteria bacterium]|nr:pyruvoyl-dependent arginine decarboxylase [Candidatus Paceibacterota bacterium]
MKLPTKIILTSGIGIGSSKLTAFDNALLNIGIGNFNLLSVSSIIPPKAKIIYLTKDNREKILPKIGSIIPTVYTCVYEEKVSERIVAMLAPGLPKNYEDHNGVIFEFAGNNITKDRAKKSLRKNDQRGTYN